jgi:hypothetical protein
MTLEEFLTIELNRWVIRAKPYSGTDILPVEEQLKFSTAAVNVSRWEQRCLKIAGGACSSGVSSSL